MGKHYFLPLTTCLRLLVAPILLVLFLSERYVWKAEVQSVNLVPNSMNVQVHWTQKYGKNWGKMKKC